MRFFKNMEKIIKELSQDHLRVLEHYNGMDLELHRQSKNNHTTAYGRYGDSRYDHIADFVGVLISDDFFASDNASSGNFDEGFLYTSSELPDVGDMIVIKSDDNKTRKFKITMRESIGTQTDVLTRYKLSNMAS